MPQPFRIVTKLSPARHFRVITEREIRSPINSSPWERGAVMTERLQLRSLEGHRVRVSLVDGSCIDDCQLICAPRSGAETLWVLLADKGDLFIPLGAVVEVWEMPGPLAA
jgi:hypothetical protein